MLRLSYKIILFLGAYVTLSLCKYPCNCVRKFPPGFLFGAATASYQIEGAWDVDGKTSNIWDYLTHNKSNLVRDNSNGDIADNSYKLYKRDVEMIRELGLDYYRFSLSWTRILPSSFPNKINKAGVEHYNNLINELLKYNIRPVITLYHWDLPQKLQELGGWTNSEIVNWFSDYARVAFWLFGDRVKNWITINEPQQICYFGYGSKRSAPALDIKGIAEYMCAKNVLLAHAKAYHIYNKEFRPMQRGSIFISLSADWYEPDSVYNIDAAYEANQFNWGQYTHPIFSKSGDFPPIMKQKIAEKSSAQGFPRSRLPQFTAEEILLIRGSSDLFALNHYTTYYVYRNDSTYNSFEVPSFEDDRETSEYQSPKWMINNSSSVKFAPWGFYKLLTQIRIEYGNPTVIITENGMDTSEGLEDDDRIVYHRGYLAALLDALEEGSNIIAYTVWNLLDDFEWLSGYTKRFGLYEVDYTNYTRTRMARKSAYVYKEIVRTRALDPNYQPDMSKPIAIDEGH